MCSTQIPGDYLVIDLSGGPNAESYPATILTVASAGIWTCNDKVTKLVLRKINEGFYFGVFPVTRGQYERVMEASVWIPGMPVSIGQSSNAMQPIIDIHYTDVRGGNTATKNVTPENSFMGKLQEKTKRDGMSLVFDLPTKEQWLQIYRLSPETTFRNSLDKLRDVGSWTRSELGIYDMNGIEEYCKDADAASIIKCKGIRCDTDTSANGAMGINYTGFRVCLTLTAQQTPPTEEAGE